MEDQYFKQSDLYDPEEDAQPSIHVYGAGSIGSHTVLSLAKTGFRDITVYDYDAVERSNIPAQLYALEDVDEHKLEAVQNRVESHTSYVPDVQAGDITAYSIQSLDVSMDTVHILAVDNLEAREHIVRKLKGMPVHVMDGRIGGWQYELYHSPKNDQEGMNALLNDYDDGGFKDLDCGEKCLFAVNQRIASLITSYVLRIVQGDDTPFKRVGNVLGDQEIIGEEP